MTDSSLELNLNAGSVTVHGTEEFVWKILDRVEVMLTQFGTKSPTPAVAAMALKPEGAADDGVAPQKGPESLYDNVFAEQNDRLKIIANVQEGNNADTARKLVLIYLYGNEIRGKTGADDDEIRALCEEHGCYDSSNFASHMKGLGNKVLKDGSSRKYTMRLTAPGRREAKQLVEEFQGAAHV